MKDPELLDCKDVQLGAYLSNKLAAESDLNKKKELDALLKKTFCRIIAPDKQKLRDELIALLKIKKRIHQHIVIAEQAIKIVLAELPSCAIITDKFVFQLIKQQQGSLLPFNVCFIDDFNGVNLADKIQALISRPSPVIVGLGGGKVMDYLKFIQMKTDLFTIAIPTSLATHVYASSKISVLPAIRDLGYQKTLDGPVPDLVILDLDFLEKLNQANPRLIRAGLGDIMAFTTAVEDWKIAEKYHSAKTNQAIIEICQEIILQLGKIDVNLPLTSWISDYVFLQALLCEITYWAGSAPASGSEHLFALAVEEMFITPPLHGELVALGCLIMAYLQERDVSEIIYLIKKLNLPSSLLKIGLSKQQLIAALQNCVKIGVNKGRFTVVNTMDLSESYCQKVVLTLMNNNYISE